MINKSSAHNKFRGFRIRRLLWRAVFLLLCAPFSSLRAQTSPAPFPGARPSAARARWLDLIGTYDDTKNKKVCYVLERAGELVMRFTDTIAGLRELRLVETALPGDHFEVSETNPRHEITFVRDHNKTVNGLKWGRELLHRHAYATGPQVRLDRSIDQLRAAALAATPPTETGPFRNSDLVELAKLDPAIHLDIRYATSNDFLGTPVYTQARAFLQRPAADAFLRALRKLQPLGYGLLIHDAYRPWYVTKIFWDATPAEGKIFVADPAQGSRHNRGCAVDLSLYDLKSGLPIEMTGLYDEMSPRSFPNYPGGTSLERWHRDLLRWAMESEGFTVYESEWWHFDYQDWHQYAIGNTPFEKLNISPI